MCAINLWAVNAAAFTTEFQQFTTERLGVAPVAEEMSIGSSRVRGSSRVFTLTTRMCDCDSLIGRRAALESVSAFAAITLVLLVLTLSQVVLGELVPKSLALQFPERTALATYVPTRWSVSLYRGFIWLLNGSGLVLLRPFGVKPGGTQHVHSLAEIRILLAESHKAGSLTPAAHKRLERGLQLSNRTVRQMMTPRNEIYALEVSTPGLERKLRTPAHFRRSTGETVTVRTSDRDPDGPRRVQGVLTAADDETVTIEAEDDGPVVLRHDQIDKARTVFEWDAHPKDDRTANKRRPGRKKEAKR